MYERYCKIRDSKKLKDTDVATMSGVPKSTFSDWKAGRYKPKLEKLTKIANALEISVDELTGIKHNAKTQTITIPEKKITEEEDILLCAFHNADELHKKMVLELLGIK